MRYRLLTQDDDAELQTLKRHYPWVMPHMPGTNGLLVFWQGGAYIVNKKSLVAGPQGTKDPFSGGHVVQVVRSRQARDDGSSTSLTIMDGKVLDGGPIRGTFLVHDCYWLQGANLTGEPFKVRMDMLNKVLPQFEQGIVLPLKLNRCFHVRDMASLVASTIPQSSLPINGLVFMPHKTGKQVIFLCQEELDEQRTRWRQEQGSKCTITGQYKPPSEGPQLLTVRKSAMADVYHVFAPDSGTRLGVACVPDKATSIRLFDAFKGVDHLQLTCTYNSKFRKWQPVV